jgi:hypothetical protein
LIKLVLFQLNLSTGDVLLQGLDFGGPVEQPTNGQDRMLVSLHEAVAQHLPRDPKYHLSSCE